MAKTFENGPKNFNSLNFFRGFAGYGVAICHYYFYLFNIKYFQYLSIFFVEFFFILSGFVLTPQLLKIFEKKDNLKIFLYRRWMRTLPLFLLALGTYSFLFKKFDIDTIKYFLLIQNFIPNFYTRIHRLVYGSKWFNRYDWRKSLSFGFTFNFSLYHFYFTIMELP